MSSLWESWYFNDRLPVGYLPDVRKALLMVQRPFLSWSRVMLVEAGDGALPRAGIIGALSSAQNMGLHGTLKLTL